MKLYHLSKLVNYSGWKLIFSCERQKSSPVSCPPTFISNPATLKIENNFKDKRIDLTQPYLANIFSIFPHQSTVAVYTLIHIFCISSIFRIKLDVFRFLHCTALLVCAVVYYSIVNVVNWCYTYISSSDCFSLLWKEKLIR